MRVGLPRRLLASLARTALLLAAPAAYEIASARAKAVGLLQRGQAQLDFTVRELERQQSLEERDVVSAREMDEALQQKDLAEAQLVEIREQMLIARLERDRAAANLALRTIEFLLPVADEAGSAGPEVLARP